MSPATAVVEPGPCAHVLRSQWGGVYSCRLLAGHAGLHTSDRGASWGQAVFDPPTPAAKLAPEACPMCTAGLAPDGGCLRCPYGPSPTDDEDICVHGHGVEDAHVCGGTR